MEATNASKSERSERRRFVSMPHKSIVNPSSGVSLSPKMKRFHRPIPLHLSSSFPSPALLSTLSSQRSPLGFGYSSLFLRSRPGRAWLRSEPSGPDDQPDVPITAPVASAVPAFGSLLTTASTSHDRSDSSECFESASPPPPASAPTPSQSLHPHPHLPNVHQFQSAPSTALPYTPPPMLSPVRNSPGLFYRVLPDTLSRSHNVPRIVSTASPVASQTQLSCSLSATTLVAAETGMQQPLAPPASNSAADAAGGAAVSTQSVTAPPAEAPSSQSTVVEMQTASAPPPAAAILPDFESKAPVPLPAPVPSQPPPPPPAFPPDMLPRINEGTPYQADLPEYFGPPRSAQSTPGHRADADAESGDLLLIDPCALEQVSGEELDSYLKVACSAALPLGGRNKEFALVLLSATGGDVREALRLLLRPRRLRAFLAARHLDDLSLSDTTAWTPLETQLFYKSIVKVGKDFYRVANELRRRMRNLQQQPALNPSLSLSLSASAGPLEAAWQPKSTRQCIEFYFFWKKFCPDEYRRLKKRIQQTNADYSMRKKSIDEAAMPLVARATPKSPIMSPRPSFPSGGALFGFQYRPPHPTHPTTASSPRPELPTITLTTQVSSTAATLATSESDSLLESSCATATRSSSLTCSLSESQSLGMDLDVDMEDVGDGDDTEIGSLELSEPAELSSRSPPAFLERDGDDDDDGDADDGERDEHMSTSSLPVPSALRHPHAHAHLHPALVLTHARSSGLESLAAASAVLSPELALLASVPGSGAGAANAPRNVPYAVGVVASELLAKSESMLQSQLAHQQHYSNAFAGTPTSTTTGFALIVAPGGTGGEEELVVKKRRGRPSKAAKALAAAKQQKLVAARAPPAESSLPFTCNRCSRRFANVKALNAHKKRHKNADANAGLMDGAPPLLSYSSQPSQSSSFIGTLSGSTLMPLSLPLPLRPPLRTPLQMPVPVAVTVPMVPVSRSAAQIVNDGLLAATGVIVRPAIIAPPSDSFHHSSYSKLQTSSSLATYFSHH